MNKRMSHVGLSVSCIKRSIKFYQQMLGMELMVHETFEGKQYESILGLPAAQGEVALMKAGDVRIELFEFLHPLPNPNRLDRPVCDVGITHFCIEVDDLDSEYARLVAAGVEFHCPPILFFDSTKATYGRDPDGNVFELIEQHVD